MSLSVIPPEGFIQERLQQGLKGDDLNVTSRWIPDETELWQRDQLRYQIGPVKARVVRVDPVETSDSHGFVQRLSLAFLEPHEGCFRFVRYLERKPVTGRSYAMNA
jgi:hypothetical protein